MSNFYRPIIHIIIHESQQLLYDYLTVNSTNKLCLYGV